MRYALAPDVGFEPYDDAVYLAPLPDGPILALNGVAALIFREATRGDAAGLLDRLVAHIDGPIDEITLHTRAFLDDLVARGVLLEVSDS
ncbi:MULTISPECIES: PqqD family peptide modification chaperone [unclassified Agromyces]|uniref:PqqD family peptide modification chaperone n=1 Tax=unclassified Agromyces TaxID=2639701 RepID=UPI003014AFA0